MATACPISINRSALVGNASKFFHSRIFASGNFLPKIKFREDVRKYDYLKYSTMKINQYKAVASPMYFFQATSDPIRRAFELTGELQAAARMFPQFHGDYEELWKNLRVFSAEFIGRVENKPKQTLRLVFFRLL